MSGRDFALGLVVGVGGVFGPGIGGVFGSGIPVWAITANIFSGSTLTGLAGSFGLATAGPAVSSGLSPTGSCHPGGGPGGGWGPTGLAFAFIGSKDGVCLGVLLAVS